jgi:hypothetical protein
MTIDWSKAPKDATHCDETNGRWYKNEADVWKFYYVCSWIAGCNRPGFGAELTPRPDAAVWRGPQDGLPPVGTVCEYKLGNGNWFKCEIISHNRLVIKCPHLETDNGEGLQILGNHEAIFRPIQSDRDRAIEEMLKVKETIYGGNDMERRQMAALYDAGYRKGEPTCSTK